MTRRPSPSHRHVYVIGPAVGLQKVGIATDPKQRLAALQTAVPFDLHLHLAIAVPFDQAHAIERRAHRMLARSCVRNEWFETSPREAMEAVRTAAAPRPIRSAQAVPAEWLRKQGKRPDVAPLLAAGRQFRPAAAFHKPVAPAPLPLFEFVRPSETDEQAAVDQAMGELLRHLSER